MESLLANIDLGQIILAILTGIATWLGATIKKVYSEKVKNETIRNVIDDCVRFVEQRSKTEQVINKYQLAKTKALNILTSKGIDITDDEIDILIESFVNSLKGEK